jgi:hypothetical protein
MKPVVHYKKDSNTKIAKGLRVSLFPIDHTSPYVSNECSAITSPVQEVWGDGVFETLNSRYVPVDLGEVKYE